ncbi:hypothetical protein ASE38_02130 [Cellulomonas sp. Root930]|nr:hypothetical protein ASE38_02130 [Cellulomonas sp. Root930]
MQSCDCRSNAFRIAWYKDEPGDTIFDELPGSTRTGHDGYDAFQLGFSDDSPTRFARVHEEHYVQIADGVFPSDPTFEAEVRAEERGATFDNGLNVRLIACERRTSNDDSRQRRHATEHLESSDDVLLGVDTSDDADTEWIARLANSRLDRPLDHWPPDDGRGSPSTDLLSDVLTDRYAAVDPPRQEPRQAGRQSTRERHMQIENRTDSPHLPERSQQHHDR